jgi:ubiquinone/menaquinone biosynthesis C-methylase UbiE
MSNEDINRLKKEYARRRMRPNLAHLNSFFNPSYYHMIQQRERIILRQLNKLGFEDLKKTRILEVGCGSGGSLLNFLRYGAQPSLLAGIDLLLDRLALAYQTIPTASLVCGDAQLIPYPAASFDLVYQFTAFSSILDINIRKKMAAEMLRVLDPHGVILWYDFWWNPINQHTRGIKPAEIRHLFPDCKYDFLKITLAPPITRIIAPISYPVTLLLESLSMFNSHYLAIIKKRMD